MTQRFEDNANSAGPMASQLASEVASPLISLLGCGWLAFPVGQKLVLNGYQVVGSTTTPTRMSVLSSMGIEPLLLRLEPEAESEDDRTDTQGSPLLNRFFSSPVMMMSIPPSSPLGADYHLGQIDEFLRRLPSGSLRHFLYISSTSVYGSEQGEVDEDSRPEPDTESGEILVQAEARLRQAAIDRGFGLTIVRPGGLIGMGRHPGRFLAGRTGIRAPEEPVNLVHQLDVVDCLVALLTQPPPAAGETRIYNAVARSHPSRREFYTQAAQLLELVPPRFEEKAASTGKIVHGERIRTATGVTFRFDDLEASLGERRL